MKSQRIFEYKKIKNSPLRSPSPDYIQRNHNIRTSSPKPLQDSRLFRNTQIKHQGVAFPIIPIEIINKNRNIGTQNIQPKDKLHKNIKNSTTISKNQKNNSQQSPQISQFDKQTEKQHSIQELFKKINEICEIIYQKNHLLKENFTNQNNKIQIAFKNLQIIKRQILKSSKQNFMENQAQFKFKQVRRNQSPLKNSPQFSNSPIKKNESLEDDSMYIFQNNELASENKRLREQISNLKQQFSHQNINLNQKHRKFNIRSSSEQFLRSSQNQLQYEKTNQYGQIIQQSRQQDSGMSITKYLFLREKITYLQKQLQNKILRITKLQNQKNDQIYRLQNKLSKKNQILQEQIKNYKKLISVQKTQLNDFRYKNKQVLPKRNLKPLEWQKEQVLSIENSSQPIEELQQSLAQNFDINKISFKQQKPKQNQQLKKYYQQLIQQNNKKYHHDLQNLQQQLKKLKSYIQKCNNQIDIKCIQCEQNEKKLKQKCNKITQLSNEAKILKQQTQQQKKQNEKLREIIQKSLKGQSHGSQISKKSRAKGFQKIQKKKSENIKQSEGSQSSFKQHEISKKQMTRSVIFTEKPDKLQ